jgi:multisubunit Na+/H+ antiporter MnhB subunit
VDVALTEAAIGAGLSGALLLAAAGRVAAASRATHEAAASRAIHEAAASRATHEAAASRAMHDAAASRAAHEAAASRAGAEAALSRAGAAAAAGPPPAERAPGRAMTAALALGCAALSAALGAAILLLPDPAPTLAPQVAAQVATTGLGNPVAAVLMSFRALDTLLEAAVLVLAVVAVWSLAPDAAWGGAPGAPPPPADGPLRLLARILPPLGVLVAVHILWIGKDAPGGKFQAAAILAAMWMLAWMAGRAAAPPVGSRTLRWAVAAGPALFLVVGLGGWLAEGAFLAWPPGLALPLILLVEVALTGSIAVALALLVLGPPGRRA